MNILHLTDLHFSTEDDYNHVADKWNKIISLARNLNERYSIDALAATGDITCHGLESEFAQAHNYLMQLTAVLSIKREFLLLCPGNHDADCGNAHSSFTHYENFLKQFDILPSHTDCDKHPRFSFQTINTCTETSLTFFDQAVIPQNSIDLINTIDKKSYGVLLMHHQPEVIKNQDRLMEIVNSGKIRLILCGHLHSTDTRLYSIKKSIVVNGMAVTPHLSWLPSGMQLVHVNTRGKVTVKSIFIY